MVFLSSVLCENPVFKYCNYFGTLSDHLVCYLHAFNQYEGFDVFYGEDLFLYLTHLFDD